MIPKPSMMITTQMGNGVDPDTPIPPVDPTASELCIAQLDKSVLVYLRVALGLDLFTTVEDIYVELGLYASVGTIFKYRSISQVI